MNTIEIFAAYFRCCQSNFRRLFPASDFSRARSDQIVENGSDNVTVLGSSRKLGEAAEHLIDGSEKHICRLSFEFLSPHVIERRSRYCNVLACEAGGITWLHTV